MQTEIEIGEIYIVKETYRGMAPAGASSLLVLRTDLAILNDRSIKFARVLNLETGRKETYIESLIRMAYEPSV